MGNFWAEKLAGREPPANAAPTGAWWDSERAPVTAEEPPPEQFPSYPSVRPVRSPQSRQESSCPECGSGNYMQPGRNSAYRCFDCNYPTVHSTSGQSVGSGTPFGKPVRQVTGSGWHPETIIGRVG